MGIQPFKKQKGIKRLEEIIKLYKAGLSFREIGAKLDISHEQARKLFNAASVDKVVDTN